jgi:predicted HAD superfamily Cof-like phosphohydrolase
MTQLNHEDSTRLLADLKAADEAMPPPGEMERRVKAASKLVRKMMGEQTLAEMVTEFHEAFGQPVLNKPTVPDQERIALRWRLVHEEIEEFREALGVNHYGAQVQETDIVALADAIGDALYVLQGTALEFGIDMGPVLKEIQRSNLTKLGADGKPVYTERGKVTKGPRYDPARVDEVLRAQGWEP